MKQLFFFCFLLITFYLYSDMPGNKPRPDYEVCITGLTALKGYAFYCDNADSIHLLSDSDKVLIQGGMGAPRCVLLWGVYKNTHQKTDTLVFCSGDKEYSFTAQITIAGNHLQMEETASTTPTPYIESGNRSLAADENPVAIKNRRIMYVISGLSFLVLTTLIVMVWRKRNKSS